MGKLKICLMVIVVIGLMLSSCNTSDNKTDADNDTQKDVSDVDIKEEDLFSISNVVQIGDRVVSLPGAYADLTEAGAKNITEDKSEGYLLDAWSAASVDMSVEDTQFEAIVINMTDERAALKTGNVKNILTSGPDIVFPGGIRVGSTLQELEETWGEPTREHSIADVLRYRYEQERHIRYSIEINRNTSEISEIRASYEKLLTEDDIYTNNYKRISLDPIRLPERVNYKVTVELPEEIERRWRWPWGESNHGLRVDNNNYILRNVRKSIGREYGRPAHPKESIFDATQYYEQITDEKLLNRIDTIFQDEGIEDYTAEVLDDNRAIGFAVNESSAKSVIVKLFKDEEGVVRLYIISPRYYSAGFPMIGVYNEDDILTDEAVDAFKHLMYRWAESIEISPE